MRESIYSSENRDPGSPKFYDNGIIVYNQEKAQSYSQNCESQSRTYNGDLTLTSNELLVA